MTTSSMTDATFASVVSYIHDLLRLYESAAMKGVGEGERLVDLAGTGPHALSPAMLKTPLDAVGFAIACVGEALRRRDGPAVVDDICGKVEAHYGWTSAVLLRRLWAELDA